MKTLTLLFFILSTSLLSNEISIDFGCYDCKKEKTNNYQKPQEEKKKENIFNNIEINGSITVEHEINKKR